ncbi:MAG: TfoX/Sxy family protein [Leptospiraceae bacterium]|nr:TfoX/Sxy family protein [Leptospiraceae bacterium]
MAYDEKLNERIRSILAEKKIRYEAKKMFGGICFLVKEKMCAGVVENKLMVRIDPDIYEDSLKKKGCSEMNFSGRPMKGFVFVTDEGIKTKKDLTGWIDKALEFNPKAVRKNS